MTEKHFVKKEWPRRTFFGISNIKQVPLVEPKQILLPPLHIKLGLVKILYRDMEQDGEVLKHLRGFFNNYVKENLMRVFSLALKLEN